MEYLSHFETDASPSVSGNFKHRRCVMKITSQKYGPSDFSVGLAQEMLITLGKVGFSPEMAKDIVNAKSGKAAKVVELFNNNQYSDLALDWQNFYRDLFGIQLDFSNLQIPNKKEGFDRLIIVAEGMTSQRLYDKCEELFPCWKWTDRSLDEVVTSDRTAKNQAYPIWIRDRVEADEELKSFSADCLKNQNISGITLEERLVYELKYFKETRKHLDIENVTLCAGSRCGDGNVPDVRWGEDYDDELGVGWCDPGAACDYLRSRVAVS